MPNTAQLRRQDVGLAGNGGQFAAHALSAAEVSLTVDPYADWSEGEVREIAVADILDQWEGGDLHLVREYLNAKAGDLADQLGYQDDEYSEDEIREEISLVEATIANLDMTSTRSKWEALLTVKRLDPHYEEVLRSIRELGFVRPAAAARSGGNVEFSDGNHRLAAAIDLGRDGIPIEMVPYGQRVMRDHWLTEADPIPLSNTAPDGEAHHPEW
ncbi:ParB N-terminal domain-containing protein [Agromyces sp. NPDC057679]|uniref:ParB N-terminal domain-containing protein n=1 Tax=Agromyces sp. NPDC057679 TaxID=3346207 RepID=UPI00366E42A7